MSQHIIGKTLLERYYVEEFIASGGMKTVYKVRDTHRSTFLAMKMLHGDLEEDPALLRSFQRDANAIRKLGHPNIVRFYGLEQVSDSFFILEAFIDGPSMKEILKRQKVLSLQEALPYFKALCAALGYAHANGVVHCDVKPANVMVDRTGDILLTDFGIARHSGSDSTSTFSGAGTPAYMAPEQVRGLSVTAETDIYALGILLYEMLAGSRPFQGTEPELTTAGPTLNERVRHAHLTMTPPDPRKFNPRLSPKVASAVLKALEKDPGRRYHTTREFLGVVCASAGIAEETIPDRIFLEGRTVSTPATVPPKPLSGEIEGKFAGPAALINHAWNRPWSQKAPFLAVGVIAIVLATALLSGGSVDPQLPTPTITDAWTFISTAAETPAPDWTDEPVLTSTPTLTITPTLTNTPTSTAIPSSLQPPAFLDWQLEVVDRGPSVGKFASMVVDGSGTHYIAYFDDAVEGLRVAAGASGAWSPRIIADSGAREGFFPSVVLDRQGVPHIVYYTYSLVDNYHESLVYHAYWSGGDWRREEAAPVTQVYDHSLAKDTSLAIGNDDTLYLVFYDVGENALRSAMKLQNNWTSPITVSRAGADGEFFPIALDGQDQPHVAFYGENGGLWYVSMIGGSWSAPESIDQGQGVGKYPSLAFDSQGNPHISYYDESDGDLKYAYMENRAWNVRTIDSQGNVGKYTSIAVDWNNKIHITYYEEYDKDRGSLKYATNAYGGTWATYTVDDNDPSTLSYGRYSSIVIEANGRPGISYFAILSDGRGGVVRILRFATVRN